MSVEWEWRKAQLLRDDLAALHQRSAATLPSVSYDHGGEHWAEWLGNIARTLTGPATFCDARFVLGMLVGDIAAHAEAGQYPTPELHAKCLLLRHGRDNALMAFVQPCWDQGEYPDPNVAWLLLHPDQLPQNFPMFTREAK